MGANFILTFTEHYAAHSEIQVQHVQCDVDAPFNAAGSGNLMFSGKRESGAAPFA